MKAVLAIILSYFCLFAAYADDERLFIDAKINGNPARFIFETGTAVPFVLFSTAAQKLGLKVTPPPKDARLRPGETPMGLCGPYNLDFGITNVQTYFAVIDVPPYLKPDADGTLGWPAVSNNILSMDFIAHNLILLTNVPAESRAWTRFRVSTNSDTLDLQSQDNKIIALDSGSADGLKLNPQSWSEWKKMQTNQPFTMVAYYTPNPGLVISEEGWADKISLGSLTMTQVPVMEASSSDVVLNSFPDTKYEATLGFAALKQLDIIVDGRHGIAYVRPKQTTPIPYDHNRLGAVFVPHNLQSENLVAHVVNGSPAYEAGICNDDVLLKIGELDVTKWRTDPNVLPLSRFFDQPAGTKLELTLKRGDKIFRTTATLRNILPPDASKN